MIVQRFNLNLIPNQSPVVVHVNQYDTGTGRLVATLYEGNKPYSPDGTAVIQGTKPDGHGFQYTATLDGNVVTADLTEQMSPVAGDVRTQIVVTESSGETGTFVFIMRVQPSALPSDADMSESDYPLIEEAIREAQEAVQTAQEATETAQEAAERAEAAITETQENAENSEAWAQGTRGGIPVGPTDPTYEHNAEYWAQYAERYAQGGIHYKASILFANIPTTGMREGDMYDITDDFTTDSRFTEGAGIKVKGGTNIAWNSDNKWDILALPYIPKTTFNGRSGSILPIAGDYDSKKILLSSALHIGGETQNDVQEALEALSNDGVKSFNGRSGSVLPMAGDYSAEQVNYDSNKTVKQVIDALATKETSDITGQQSLLKDTVGWTGKNQLNIPDKTLTSNGVTINISNGVASFSGTNALSSALWIAGTGINIPKGTYIFNGLDTTQNVVTNLQLLQSDNTEIVTININDSSKTVTISNDLSNCKIHFRIVANGNTNGIKAYPMLRHADITDPTYEPYHESVETMYEEEIHGVNLIDTSKYAKKEDYGITWTKNPDGSWTANGTATNYSYINFVSRTNNNNILKANTAYIVSGVPNQAHASIVVATQTGDPMRFYYGSDGYIAPVNYDRSITFQINIDTAGTTVNNVVFRPMLRKADIEDSTYHPYNHQAIQNQLNAQGVLGAKNLLPNNAKSQTINGVTFTVNSDGSITGVGTSNSSDMAYFVTGSGWGNSGKLLSETEIKAGETYILSKGFVKSGIALFIRFYQRSTDLGGISTKDEDNKKFTVPTNTDHIVAVIRIDSGVTISNSNVFYPMLRLASDPDDTYVPYAMTNRELTENKVDRKAPTATDCNAFTDHFMSITNSTLNSAQKQGLSTAGNGFLITAFMQNVWNVQFIFSYDGHIYKRTVDGTADNWTQWATVA